MNHIWIYLAAALLIAVLLWLAYRRYVVPARIIRNGMELLSGQETNNRLRLTGNPAADRVVKLFNTLLERLQEQTIRNREQNRILSRLIEMSPLGVIIMDFDDIIAECNPAICRFLRVEPQQIIGHRLENLSSQLANMIQMAPQGKSTIRISETEIYICHKLQLIDRGFARPFIFLDNMADEVRRIEKETYSTVVRVMSHEVNNTLGGLNSLLQTLLYAYDKEEEVKEVIESGMESCVRLGDFVNSYADVARVPEPVKTPVDIYNEIEHLQPFLSKIAGKEIELRLLPISENRLRLPKPMDVSLIERVFVNIVKNASEAIPPGIEGKITIEVCYPVKGETGDRGIEIVIANNGIPIGAKDTDSLFRPFYTTKPGGRGTGLALVAEILSRHGWGYSLATDPDGETRFRIRTP